MCTHIFTWISLSSRILCLYLWYGKAKPVFYNKALEYLRNNNILFTKIFQSLANNTSVKFSPELCAEFNRYSANTSYTENEIDYECLDKIELDYGIQIDRRVVNSGMIALVFNGVVNNEDKRVVVKLKRKRIDEQLRRGCESVTAFHSLVSYWFPTNLYVRILKPFVQNITDIIDQCNFDREIQNLQKAKDDFEPLPFIHIPAVYNKQPTAYDPKCVSNLQDTNFILMEHIEGTHMLPPSVSETERFTYLEQFATFISYTYLCNTIHHTDLHGGNILFMKEGLGIIDYGMAIQISDDIHEAILSIISIIQEAPPIHEIDFIETFKHMFVPPIERSQLTNVETVEDMMIELATPMLESIDIDQLQFIDNVSRIAKYLQRDIVLNKDVYKLILGLSMLGAKVSILGPYCNETAKIKSIERRALSKSFTLIMSPS